MIGAALPISGREQLRKSPLLFATQPQDGAVGDLGLAPAWHWWTGLLFAEGVANRPLTAGGLTRSGQARRGLADVLDVLLDKRLVIDVFLQVSLIGIEIASVDARVVIA